MAERQKPGFVVPLGFYDGPEVRSIPRRIRAAAIGVWTLAGNYSATKLLDGFVDAETLKTFGCTPAIRSALSATMNAAGELSPLWIDGKNGGIQFTNWPKWQRTNAEVSAYRSAEAERKRVARKSSRPATNTGNVNLSGRTSNGQSAAVPAVSVEPETETETETKTGHSATVAPSPNVADPAAAERGHEAGRSAPVDPSASRLVATLVPANIPAAVKTSLRLQASVLMVGDQLPADVVAESLRRWCAKPDAGPGLLPHIASEVVRENAGLAANGGRPPGPTNKLRSIAELAARERAAENDRTDTARKELAP